VGECARSIAYNALPTYMNPMVPVAQNEQPILQPTCDDMQTVDRALCTSAGLFFLSYLLANHVSVNNVCLFLMSMFLMCLFLMCVCDNLVLVFAVRISHNNSFH
jgi:hypothetical protein